MRLYGQFDTCLQPVGGLRKVSHESEDPFDRAQDQEERRCFDQGLPVVGGWPVGIGLAGRSDEFRRALEGVFSLPGGGGQPHF